MIAYLPALSINNPGNVIYYFQYVIKVVTFDPIPCDDIYKRLGIFNFQWTNSSPLIAKFNDIGFSSRNYVSAMGSLFLFMLAFFFSILISSLLLPCKRIHFVNKIRLYFKIPGFLRAAVIRFLLEGYIEFFIASLLNWENITELPLQGIQWERTAFFSKDVTSSDLIALYLGHAFTILSLAFPFFAVYALNGWKTNRVSELHA